MLRPYKFQIVAVCQKVEDGIVVGEKVLSAQNGEPIVAYGLDGLRQFADVFEEQLQLVQQEP